MHNDKMWLSQRAILAPKNVIVTNINERLLNQLPGEEKVYKSMDCVTEKDEQVQYPTEFLNKFEIDGAPSHKLSLKVGAPIMLLRNLDPPHLVNGTRLVVTNLLQNVIVAEILGGKHDGREVLIPRIHFTPNPNEVPFSFRRTQFPVCLAFAMSINKSQGIFLLALIFHSVYFIIITFRSNHEGGRATLGGAGLLPWAALRWGLSSWKQN